MNLEKKLELRNGEKIITTIRQHAAKRFWAYVFGFGLVVADAFCLFWLLNQAPWGQRVAIAGFVVGGLVIIKTLLSANHNLTILTTERVVDISRRGWLEEVISAVYYRDVRDAYVERRGVGAKVFGYGSLIVETSGRANLVMDYLPRPERWQTIIFEEKDKYLVRGRLADRGAIYSAFLDLIPELSEDELCEIKDVVDERLADYPSEREFAE